ncbi:unnamed protein product [Microthlaspi erraticum]|uniref:HMA domain-containing protein n=1 Tax=Microthlaspi erraticum TaxID=1685480 RepID=A0A6D2LC97_9BRAS|nr:unnamed protein product [Microthlaspi erraticum]
MVCCIPIPPPTVSNCNLDVEIKIPDCSHCATIMTEVIPRFKGVETCVTDIVNQNIAVRGSFNLEKLLKKLSKLTGEDQVVLVKKEVESEIVQKKNLGALLETDKKSEEYANNKEMDKILMFNDENPNARCTIS